MTDRYNLADAKARLSELAERAAAGENVIITKRGKPVVQLSRPDGPRKPVDLARLRQLTADMPPAATDSASLIRQLRDDARY